jgi:hypothetical protein
MTESEWLFCDDPQRMLSALRGRLSGRKLRLFACACCRTLQHLFVEEAYEAVEASEHYADDLVDSASVAAAREAAKRPDMSRGNSDYLQRPDVQAALRCAVLVAWGRAASWDATRQAVHQLFRARRVSSWNRAGYELAELLRDAAGSPFRSANIDPHWLTTNVVDLARTIYEERAFDRLLILADALMDAGCSEEDILAHCRTSGPHAKGCWVVDLILGKS